MKDNQRLIDYLEHIVEAIVRIRQYVEDVDENSFLQNELIQDAVIRNLEVIGEASRNISRDYPQFTDQHAEIPFSFAYEMRNALSHGYFKIDLEIVWKTIEQDLPDMETKIRAVLAE